MVTLLKPNKIRSINPKDLNRDISREHYSMRTVEVIISCMPGASPFLMWELNFADAA